MARQIIHTEVLTSGAAQVNGTPIFVGGRVCEAQSYAPANLWGLQVSMDRVNWVAAEDKDSGAITTLGAVYRVLWDRPLWIRAIVAIDGGAPQFFGWTLVVREQLD